MIVITCKKKFFDLSKHTHTLWNCRLIIICVFIIHSKTNKNVMMCSVTVCRHACLWWCDLCALINGSCSPCVSQKADSVDESRALVHQVSNESRASITESLSEFFDAQEVLLSASSSENEVNMRESNSSYQKYWCVCACVCQNQAEPSSLNLNVLGCVIRLYI